MSIPTTRKTTSAGYVTSDCLSEEYSRRRIYITGEITDSLAADICCQINHLASLSDDDITLWIMSPGGSVSAGAAILDTMSNCGCDIRTVVMGTAASMAAVLAASGTKGKRYALPNAEIMIHQPSGGAKGQATEIQIAAENILKTKKRLNEILAANTGKPYDVIAADTERDYYMSAEEAKAYGLIDDVITNR